MEERFLKARQEREETRLNRVKEISENAQQRQQFDDQFSSLEDIIENKIRNSDIENAKAQLGYLRDLVQDAANSMSLTAHEMARFNATLSRLQQSITDHAPSSGIVKKFKFSSKAKATKEHSAASRELLDLTSAAFVETQQPPAAPEAPGTVYGPLSQSILHVDPSKAAFIKGCTECSIYCFPIAGSVFVSGCTDCTIYVACHQLRMKDCHNVSVYVWCASTPIIEKCDGMAFAPYTCWRGLLKSSTADGATYASHEEWVEKVGDIHDLPRTTNMYTIVDDFQWLRKTPSPHWHVMDAASQQVSDEVVAASS